MNEKLKEKVKESLSSVLPITLIVLVLSVTLVPMEIGTLALFLTGAVLLIVGMGFFQLGAEMSMTPLGEGVGRTLAKREKVILVVLVAFALGTIITIAEPDLQVLANQVASIPNSVLIWTVAVGVGVFLALAVLRILFRVSLAKCPAGSLCAAVCADAVFPEGVSRRRIRRRRRHDRAHHRAVYHGAGCRRVGHPQHAGAR